MAQSDPERVVEFRPLPSQLEAMVHKAAMDSANVKFGTHALERMDERGITTLDALRVLKSGHLSGRVDSGSHAGEWKCKLVKQMRGSREIGVVTVVLKNGRLFVKTVEWEDL